MLGMVAATHGSVESLDSTPREEGRNSFQIDDLLCIFSQWISLTATLPVISNPKITRNTIGGTNADARRFSWHGNYGTVHGREPGQSRTRGCSVESNRRQGSGRRA